MDQTTATPPAHPPAASATPDFLRVAGLTKRFGPATVVRDVAFDVAPAEFVCILGPSGCGKTTLLRLIAGFETADGGTIHQAGRDITHLPPEQRDFGIVFQSYALFPNRNAAGNIAFGLESVGTPRAARAARVAELLALVGLTEHGAKFPSQLSGGQQQRVALARALALSPGLLLLDEPLSALDANVRAYLRDELRALQRRVGVTALMVTHDQTEALSIADRIIVMNAGRIEQAGTPVDLYLRPATLFVARFLGEMNAWPIERTSGATAEVAGLPLRLPAAPAHLPAAPLLCIRPAGIVVGPEATTHDNRLLGRVAAVTFLGDSVRLGLTLDPGGMALNADVPLARLGRIPEPGATLQLALPPAQIILLSGQDPPREHPGG